MPFLNDTLLLMYFHNEPIFQWLSQYAYQPETVYLAAFGMMLASGFGLPLPEEVTIISVGLLAYMGAHPEIFPPPAIGAAVVNGYEAAVVVSLAVFFADMLVFMIGRTVGRKILAFPTFQRFFGGRSMDRVNRFVKEYGSFAAFLFRFTPGIRFPGHIFLGTAHFPFLKFISIDGLAIIISVPTQVLLAFFFGDTILHIIKRFKIILFIILLLAAIFFSIRKILEIRRKQPGSLL